MTEMMNWQKMMQQSYRSCEQMADLFAFSEAEVQSLKEIEERYPVCVNPYYFGLIDLEDKEDPIRKMSIPNGVEFSPGGKKILAEKRRTLLFQVCSINIGRQH